MRGSIVLTSACAAALVIGVLGGPAAAPAAATVATPTPSVALPAELDNAAFYEPQTRCDPVAQPGATALADLLHATYGPATIYIPRACTSSTSEHFDGRAVDWMRSMRVPAEKEMADGFVDWLLAPDANGTPQAMARRLGIMYIIWNNRMIRMYDSGRGWTDYRGCTGPASAAASLDTSCHRNHVHFSMSWDGAAGFTSWWTGAAVTLPYCPARSTRVAPSSGSAQAVGDPAAVAGLVPVPATTILDTAAGAGAGLTGGCRLLAGRTLYPTAAVPGLVPPGAHWAAVAVSSTSNAPASLLAWSSGAPRPAGAVATSIGTSAHTLLVPIASDGTIALGTSMGAATLAAQLVGYVAGDVSAAADASAAAGQRPGKPRSVKATSARRAVKTSWKAPASTGGSAITGYRVEALTSAKKGARVAGVCSAGAKARTCTIKRLTRGKRYWMSVSVANGTGSTWAARKGIKIR